MPVPIRPALLGPTWQVTRVLERPLTQKQLGWHLARSALIPDLEEGQYFNDQTSRS